MGQRYWVVGGEYADCRFGHLEPGTERMVGPFEDERKARNEWSGSRSATIAPRRRATGSAWSPATMSDVLDLAHSAERHVSRYSAGADEVLSRGARFRHGAAPPLRRPPPGPARAPQGAAGSASTPASFPISSPRRARFARRVEVAPIPADLMDRRVEITGPTNRKMVINALNSGAQAFMADFEDATSPTWDDLVEGQVNLDEYWQGRLHFDDPQSGKQYELGANPAVLMVRPRGWHLEERAVGSAFPAACSISALYVWHNAQAAIEGLRPLFLSAQARKPSRGGAVERRLRLCRGAARAGARHDQGDGADRDHPGRVRDGRDPPRAAGEYRRPQLRPLGLHLLAPSSGSAARPTG